MAMWISVDGKIDTETPLETGEKLLPQLQKFVGGYIEEVHLNDGSVMIINEEGALESLPNNVVATSLLYTTGTYVLTVNGYLQGPVLHVTEEEYQKYFIEDEDEDEDYEEEE